MRIRQRLGKCLFSLHCGVETDEPRPWNRNMTNAMMKMKKLDIAALREAFEKDA